MIRTLAVVCASALALALGAPVTASAATRTETITVAGQKVQVITNVPFAGNTTVDRAVIVIHGTGRNAKGYHERMTAAAKRAGVAGRTAVVAPLFNASWSNDTWKQGGDSSKGVSSFAVADALLAILADRTRFPNLHRVTLAGHSAGGQFVQRYAALGKQPATTYLVMNPSSFLYLDQWRPATTKGCPTSYNRYKYGLDRRTGYVGALSNQQVIARYLSRPVTVANGDQDTAKDPDLDTTCPATAQGPTRLARGRAFTAYIRDHFPTAHHRYLVIPGVGHDSAAMFADPIIRPILFGG